MLPTKTHFSFEDSQTKSKDIEKDISNKQQPKENKETAQISNNR